MEVLACSSAALAQRMEGLVGAKRYEGGDIAVTYEVKRCISAAPHQVTKVALCRCGHSANKPYCVGSHKRGFVG